MSVQKENLAPFKHRQGGKPGGIEVELVQAIAKQVGVRLKFIDYSIAEGRQAFLEGGVTVDCCLNKVWFPSEKAKSVQLFSEPIYRLIEIWVFRKGTKFPVSSTKDLHNKRVAGIKGFNYPGEEDFGTRVDGTDVSEVLDILLRGDADIAVLERHAASLGINDRKLDIEFGRPYYSVEVALRLHNSQRRHMDKVNQVIGRLKSEGTIDDIIRRNLRSGRDYFKSSLKQ